MFNKVLIPLDGSEVSEGILPYISTLAKRLDLPMVLLSVLDPEVKEFGRPKIVASSAAPKGDKIKDHFKTYPSAMGESPLSPLLVHIEGRMREYLEGVIGDLSRRGVQAIYHISFGRPATNILEVASLEECGLIAMSTHGRNMVARALLGSVTDRVLHTSGIPVLTITPDKAKELGRDGTSISNIIVPLDVSSLAESVLPVVEELAHRMSARVLLISDVVLGVFSPTQGLYRYTSYFPEDDRLEKETLQYLEGLAEKLRAKGFDVTCMVLRGGPNNAIFKLVKETPDSIIVMSTHGRSGLKRFLLGSLTEKMVRMSSEPVLIVPPRQINEE